MTHQGMLARKAFEGKSSGNSGTRRRGYPNGCRGPAPADSVDLRVSQARRYDAGMWPPTVTLADLLDRACFGDPPPGWLFLPEDWKTWKPVTPAYVVDDS